MRGFSGGLAALLCGLGAMAGASPALSGDYVEARTCSVYTGACHANGEAVTIGREAILVWHIADDTTDPIRLAGLNAAAVIAGDSNLAWGEGNRRSVLYVDSRANVEQRKALASEIEGRYAAVLGRVVAVRSVPIEFTRTGLDYGVRVPGILQVRTTRYACAHCIMPHQVWYDPFVRLRDAMVAKATVNEFKGAPELNVSWLRSDENSSFVGEF